MTLQEFAKSILPIVQAEAEGKTIECKKYGNLDWDNKVYTDYYSNYEYRIKKEPLTLYVAWKEIENLVFFNNKEGAESFVGRNVGYKLLTFKEVV